MAMNVLMKIHVYNALFQCSLEYVDKTGSGKNDDTLRGTFIFFKNPY